MSDRESRADEARDIAREAAEHDMPAAWWMLQPDHDDDEDDAR